MNLEKRLYVFFFFVVIILGLVTINNSFKQKETSRYEIISIANSQTILLDKQTGLTWRNMPCDSKNKAPHCWAKMSYFINPEVYPIGEAQRIKNETRTLSEEKLKSKDTVVEQNTNKDTISPIFNSKSMTLSQLNK